jgi:hypothetical protein
MADSKISALPASTTPLAGTEVLPIVQSTTTKQVSVANLTAGRAVSALSLTSTTTLGVTGTSTLSGNAIISVTDNTNAALRITQLGTGNALLVEDSTNPDASPFVINNFGQLFQGYVSSISYQALGLSYAVGAQQIAGVDGNTSSQLIAQFSTSSLAPTLVFAKSKNATVGSHTAVSSGDSLGAVVFDGSDGTNFIEAARISAAVDGTPGTNDMPGRLVFYTTADGASSPTERMRIDSSGTVSIPGTLSIAAYTETIVASGTVGASATLAITAGTVLTATLTSATACTFTMPTATAGKSFILLLKQPASGTATTATFTGVKFNASGAPTITATVGKMDILTFVADGTNWYGSYSQGYTP